MSWATCYSGSNNVYLNKPPLMSDGRIFNNLANDSDIIENKKFESSKDYKKFIQENSEQIIQDSNDFMMNNSGVISKSKTTSYNGNVPFVYSSNNDESKPAGYVESDLKNAYLSREQLQSQMVAPKVLNLNKI
jgi:hypothetical protein